MSGDQSQTPLKIYRDIAIYQEGKSTVWEGSSLNLFLIGWCVQQETWVRTRKWGAKRFRCVSNNTSYKAAICMCLAWGIRQDTKLKEHIHKAIRDAASD